MLAEAVHADRMRDRSLHVRVGETVVAWTLNVVNLSIRFCVSNAIPYTQSGSQQSFNDITDGFQRRKTSLKQSFYYV